MKGATLFGLVVLGGIVYLSLVNWHAAVIVLLILIIIRIGDSRDDANSRTDRGSNIHINNPDRGPDSRPRGPVID
jgi:hypothetical protein